MPQPLKLSLPPIAGLTVTAAAHAVGIEPEALRTWLDRGRFELLAPQPTRAWRRCQPIDVSRIAVAASLVSFGLTLAEARMVLKQTVDRRLFSVVSICGGDAPWHLLRSELAGLIVTVARVGGTVLVGKNAAHASAVLTLNVAEIVRNAEQRARDYACGK